ATRQGAGLRVPASSSKPVAYGPGLPAGTTCRRGVSGGATKNEVKRTVRSTFAKPSSPNDAMDESVPIHVTPCHAARRVWGPDLQKMAALAAKAIIRGKEAWKRPINRAAGPPRSLLGSAHGDLFLELDIGVRLSDPIVLEDELQRTS